jgi:hypothetical protein
MTHDTAIINKPSIDFLETEVSITEINDAISGVDNISNVLDRGISDTEELVQISELAKDKQIDSINDITAVAIENICSRLGYSGYKRTETISLENIGDLIKKAWEAIKAMFNRMWEGLKALWNKITNNTNKATEKAQAAEDRVAEVKRVNPEGYKVSITEIKTTEGNLRAYCNAFNTTNAKHLNENIVTVLNNHLIFLNFLDKYIERSKAIFSELSKDKIEDIDGMLRLVKEALNNPPEKYKAVFSSQNGQGIFLNGRYLKLDPRKGGAMFLATVTGFKVNNELGHYPTEHQFTAIKKAIDDIADKLNKVIGPSQNLETAVLITIDKINKQIQASKINDAETRFKMNQLNIMRSSLTLYNGSMLGLTAASITRASQYLEDAAVLTETNSNVSNK